MAGIRTTHKVNGTLGTGNTTLYTVPASTTTTIISVILSNKTAVDATATITFDGISFTTGHVIAANDTLVLELKNAPALLETTELIEGLAGTTASIDYYITYIQEV